ncbi:2'-5' RNA ligase family protein [Chungangia koreensis]|uniref:2'-5' RNA ligase family protein n=1 Tax=Chungangia koreensis TaxID=752657 RepID=A0ABV8X6J4_9LACT
MYFIGIVPPDDYLNRVQEFQRKWIQPLGVEPHITLKAQGGLTDDLNWLKNIETICKNFKPFQISLGKPTYFGENILYLSVHSDQIRNLHELIVKSVKPTPEQIKQYFELDQYVPHLTLGKESYGSNISSGISKAQLTEMEEIASTALCPYPTFDVNFVRVYELKDQRYVPLTDLPLGK